MLNVLVQNSYQFEGLKALLAEHFKALDSYLKCQILAFEPEAVPYLAPCFESRGKRLRATLLFLAGWTGSEPVDPDLVKAAAIVELVHYATLVHDDVLDSAWLRQGVPTLSARHGPTIAILLGDILFSHALTLASEYPSTTVCQIVSKATRQVCTGEVSQTLHRDGERITLAAYERSIDLKTAELFSASTHLGALLSGYSDAYVAAAKSFGRHLGTAYQIYDDVADCLGDEAAIGKTLGTDLASGKLTLPGLLLLDILPKAEGDAFLASIVAKSLSFNDFKTLLIRHNIPAKSKARFDQSIQAAQKALSGFEDLPATPLLQAALNYIESLWVAS